MKKSAARLVTFLCLFPAFAAAADAQEIPHDEYLKYVPLNYPRLVQQTPATEALQFLGLDLSGIPLENLGLVFTTLGDVPSSERVYRNEFAFGLTLSF
jgi:hypothetical protein